MAEPKIKQGWLRATLYSLALPIVILILSLPVSIILTRLTGIPIEEITNRENIYVLIIFQLILAAGTTFLTFLFITDVDKKKFVSLGFFRFRIKKDMIAGILLGLILIGSGFTILYLSGSITIEGLLPDLKYILASIFFYAIISWIEEISFRGYILNNLMDSFNHYVALIVSSVMFAFFHGLNPGLSFLSLFNLFLAGILLGIVFLYTRTIWFALGLHLSWNFFQGPVFGFPVSGISMDGFIKQQQVGSEIITGGSFGFEGSILCSMLLITAIFAADRYYNKTIHNTFDKNN